MGKIRKNDQGWEAVEGWKDEFTGKRGTVIMVHIVYIMWCDMVKSWHGIEFIVFIYLYANCICIDDKKL